MKECSECGSVVNDEAPYCEACGGHSWRPVRARQAMRQQLLAAAVVLALLAAIYWFFVYKA